MKTALCLLVAQGVLGAFDTLYFHEFRARLPAGGARTRVELALHAMRSLIYAVVFATLPSVAWHGAWAFALAALLMLEIAITLADFVVEVRARQPVDVLAGERVTHAVMAIIYGAFVAHLAPVWIAWIDEPTSLVRLSYGSPWLERVLPWLGVGVLASGTRDGYASLGLPGGSWPYEAGSSVVSRREVER